MASRVKLVLEANGRRYTIGSRELRIGRGLGNQINLTDTESSRHHAVVWTDQGIAYIRDVGSRNGTFVNDERIQGQQVLRHGDRIRLGRSSVTVQSGIGDAGDEVGATGFFIAAIVGLVVVALGLLAYVLINNKSAAPGIGPNPAASGPLTSPALSTVVVEDLGATMQIGSGILVDARGYILTSAVALSKAGIIVPEGCQNLPPEVLVGLIPEEARPPERFYRARVYCGDPGAGLALLDVVATDGGGPLPRGLIFPAAALGNSETIQLGSEIKVIGFPGPNRPIKSVPGNISEFLPGLKGTRTWITTDSSIDEGMFGGIVVGGGQIIAMPTGRPLHRTPAVRPA